MVDKHKISESIRTFFEDKRNGESWRKILLNAPAFAMERIAISMYHTVYGPTMTKEDKEEYRNLREEIEATLEREDLEYLVKVMPESKKEHYRSLLSLLPQAQEQAQATPAQAQANA